MPSLTRVARPSGSGAHSKDAVIEGLCSVKVAVLSDVLLALERAQRASRGSDGHGRAHANQHVVTMLCLRRAQDPAVRPRGGAAGGVIDGGGEGKGWGGQGNVVGSLAVVDVGSQTGEDTGKRAAFEVEQMLCALAAASRAAAGSHPSSAVGPTWSPTATAGLLTHLLWPLCRTPAAIVSVVVTLAPSTAHSKANAAAALQGWRMLTGCRSGGAHVSEGGDSESAQSRSRSPSVWSDSVTDAQEEWTVGVAGEGHVGVEAVGGVAELIRSEVLKLASPDKGAREKVQELHHGLLLQVARARVRVRLWLACLPVSAGSLDPLVPSLTRQREKRSARLSALHACSARRLACRLHTLTSIFACLCWCPCPCPCPCVRAHTRFVGSRQRAAQSVEDRRGLPQAPL